MADPPRAFPGYALGGYEPGTGRQAHAAGQPRLVPAPSLLRSLLTDHLDPGYAASAARRSPEPPPTGRAGIARLGWQAVAVVLIVAVFGTAAAQARSLAPGVKNAQQVLAGSVRAVGASADALADQRSSLSAQVDELRRKRLNDDAEGQTLLAGLDELSLAAATTEVGGPGLTVTVTDPGASRNLSGAPKQRVGGSQQVILDRDLQLVVNSLWAGEAEAIAVDDVRIGPNVTIRQAGGAILVDNTPIDSPYTIVAIGPPHAMQDAFVGSTGLYRLRLLEMSYGVGVTVTSDDGLVAPAGTVRDVRFAKQIGS